MTLIGMMTMIEEKSPDADEIQSESLSIGPQPNKYAILNVLSIWFSNSLLV